MSGFEEFAWLRLMALCKISEGLLMLVLGKHKPSLTLWAAGRLSRRRALGGGGS